MFSSDKTKTKTTGPIGAIGTVRIAVISRRALSTMKETTE